MAVRPGAAAWISRARGAARRGCLPLRLRLELWPYRSRRSACLLAGRRIGAIMGGRRLVESRCWNKSSGGTLSQVGRFQGQDLLGLASSRSLAQGSWLDCRVVPRFSGGRGSCTAYSIANRTVRSTFVEPKVTAHASLLSIPQAPEFLHIPRWAMTNT